MSNIIDATGFMYGFLSKMNMVNYTYQYFHLYNCHGNHFNVFIGAGYCKNHVIF